MSAPTSVYRYYDTDGALVYVGITARGIQRQTEHNIHAEWWPHVVRQDVEHYSTREDATSRERELIQRFRPPFNRQHNPEHDQLRAVYLASRPAMSPARTAYCSPCPTDCDWDQVGVDAVGCLHMECLICHSEWHGMQSAYRRGREAEAREFLAFLDAATEGTEAKTADTAASILKLGAWLARHVRERSDDDLTQRRADMLARHFAAAYRRVGDVVL